MPTPYPAIPQQAWNVTDTALMSLLQLATLEPDDAGDTWPSGMWSQDDVLSYMTNILQDFLHRTGITSAIAFLDGVPNQGKYDLPQNLIDLRRIAWRPGTSGTDYVELYAVDTFQQDMQTDDWSANASQVPTGYLLNLLPSLTVMVTPTPNDQGQAELTITTLGRTPTGGGVPLSVPDDWTPYIMWGVLAQMFGKSGEASDPQRASYCAQRYEEGIEMARLLSSGVDYAG